MGKKSYASTKKNTPQNVSSTFGCSSPAGSTISATSREIPSPTHSSSTVGGSSCSDLSNKENLSQPIDDSCNTSPIASSAFQTCCDDQEDDVEDSDSDAYSGGSSTQNSICSEQIPLEEFLEDEGQLFMESGLENHLAFLHDRLTKCSPDNEEMQEKLQLSFLIQKYSELLAKNTPTKPSRATPLSEEQEKASNSSSSSSNSKSWSSPHQHVASAGSDSANCSCTHRTEEYNAKEKEHLRNEITKVNSLKSRLESLCKELQTESKRIKDEGKKFLRNVESFTPISPTAPTCSLPDSPAAAAPPSSNGEMPAPLSLCIPSEKLDIAQETNPYLLNTKLNALVDQYEQREKDYYATVHRKDVQLQYSLARYLTQQETLSQECIKVETLKAQVLNFVKTENELKRQLAVYVDKFKQVEETLSKSNELFMTFRKETEKMTKNLAKFEKENDYLKNKVATLNRNILEMAEEKTKNQKTTETLANQKMKLEVLCRTLQAERNEALALASKLKKAEQDVAPVASNVPAASAATEEEKPPL